jgi:hypothetical protein
MSKTKTEALRPEIFLIRSWGKNTDWIFCILRPPHSCGRAQPSIPTRGSAFPTSPGYLYNVPPKAGEGRLTGSERVHEFPSPESWLIRQGPKAAGLDFYHPNYFADIRHLLQVPETIEESVDLPGCEPPLREPPKLGLDLLIAHRVFIVSSVV